MMSYEPLQPSAEEQLKQKNREVNELHAQLEKIKQETEPPAFFRYTAMAFCLTIIFLVLVLVCGMLLWGVEALWNTVL
jgi:hypothetical protein